MRNRPIWMEHKETCPDCGKPVYRRQLSAASDSTVLVNSRGHLHRLTCKASRRLRVKDTRTSVTCQCSGCGESRIVPIRIFFRAASPKCPRCGATLQLPEMETRAITERRENSRAIRGLTGGRR